MPLQPGSITNAIAAIKNDDLEAAQLIWDRFFKRLCAFAESRIYKRNQRVLAPDEVASNAYLALVNGLKAGRFEKVRNRDELWQMLTLITIRKAINAQKKIQRIKRGDGRVLGNSAFGRVGIDGVVDFMQREMTPEIAAQLQETSQRLLAKLPSDELRQIAVWRMAGYSNAEIAERLGCVERTVERKLNLIRKCWSELSDGS